MLLGLFIILIAGGAILFFSVGRVLVSEFDSALHSQARALASLVKFEDGRIEMEFSDEFMPAFERKENPEFFQIWLADGQPFEQSRSLAGKNLPRRAGPVDSPEFWDLTLPDGRRGRAVGIRFVLQNEEDETVDSALSSNLAREVTLAVARGRSDLDGELHAVTAVLLSICVLILFGTAVVVNVVVRKGLRPLQAVGDRAAAIGASSLETRFPADCMPSELRPICERLNELLARLEKSFQRERRFNADIAHELRTPIAELRTMAEVALKYPGDGRNSKAGFEDALNIALQMEGIVTALLALTRCETGQQVIQSEIVNLGDTVKEIWNPLKISAREKNLDVVEDIQPDIRLRTDKTLLKSILHNLLSNAVEYAPRSGRVEICARLPEKGFLFSVSNTCGDLAPEDLPHLFEPFWRKDAARSDSSHSGLGLSLALSFARTLSMDIHADLPEKNNLRITLEPREGKVSASRQ